MQDTVPSRDSESNLNPKTTYIYSLGDPLTHEIRYIGKSNDPQRRLRVHIRNSKHKATHKDRWINHLKTLEMEPILNIVEEVSADEWQEREAYWIGYYHAQGSPLTNETPGGEGLKLATPEIRDKISKGMQHALATTDLAQRRSEMNKGKKLSPETIAKRSAAYRGKKLPPRSPEHIEKLRQARLGKPVSPETRAKLSAAHKGRVKSPEECKHISEAKTGKKRKPFTEEARRNMSNASRGRKYPPRSAETRKRISDAQRGKKRGPYSAERRANIAAGIRRARAMKQLPSESPGLWD